MNNITLFSKLVSLPDDLKAEQVIIVHNAPLAYIPAIKTAMVVFDTAVADLTEQLTNPVALLFSIQLGGGTDIHDTLTYCAQIIWRCLDTVVVKHPNGVQFE